MVRSRPRVMLPAPASPARVAQNRRKPRPQERPSLRALCARLVQFSRVQYLRDERVRPVVLRALAVVSTIAVGFALLSLIERHLHTSSSFAIRNVEVTGNSQLTTERVMQAAGLSLGQNVFAVGPDAAQRRLLEEPWIESALVRRRLPATFSIEVRERRAVALLSTNAEMYLVSDEGLVIKSLAVSDPYDLPVISGIDPDLRVQDEHARENALVGAVSLLHDYQDAGLWRREPVSEVHIENDGSLSLYVGADATYVRLGKAPFRQKLERLRQVLSRLSQDKARAVYVYLDNQRRPDRVTARLR